MFVAPTEEEALSFTALPGLPSLRVVGSLNALGGGEVLHVEVDCHGQSIASGAYLESGRGPRSKTLWQHMDWHVEAAAFDLFDAAGDYTAAGAFEGRHANRFARSLDSCVNSMGSYIWETSHNISADDTFPQFAVTDLPVTPIGQFAVVKARHHFLLGEWLSWGGGRALRVLLPAGRTVTEALATEWRPGERALLQALIEDASVSLDDLFLAAQQGPAAATLAACAQGADASLLTAIARETDSEMVKRVASLQWATLLAG